MGTTSIRLPPELKARVEDAAAREGTSAHSFMLEAIAEKAERAERRAAFHAEGQRRYQRFLETGEAIPWADYRAYLLQHMRGENPGTPVARKHKP